MSLAPIDSQKQVPFGTNFGVILPACDGDVSTLAGANAYERSKYPNAADAFAKVQWYVQGANHNYFNTVWTATTAPPTGPSASNPDVACGEDQPNSIRLFPSDQRKVGLGLMAGFLRNYLGMEKPVRAADDGRGRLPGQRLPGAARRRLPGAVQDQLRRAGRGAPGRDPARRRANPLGLSAAGGELTGTGLRDLRLVQRGPRPALGRADQAVPAERRRHLDGLHQPLASAASSRSPGTGRRRCGRSWPAAARDASRFGTLSLRTAVNFADARNPVSNGTDPASASQDFDVVLIDRSGRLGLGPRGRTSGRAGALGRLLPPPRRAERPADPAERVRGRRPVATWTRSSCASARPRRAARSSSPTSPSRSRPPAPRRSPPPPRSRRWPGPSASTRSPSTA